MRLMGRVARGEGARACRCSSNVLTSSAADSIKTKDSMMGAASTPSEAEKGEKVDTDQAERCRAWLAEERLSDERVAMVARNAVSESERRDSLRCLLQANARGTPLQKRGAGFNRWVLFQYSLQSYCFQYRVRYGRIGDASSTNSARIQQNNS